MQKQDQMKSKESLFQFAIILAVITVIYNLFEGVAAVYFGLEDETLALFGFGLDSFVEVMSGIGILHMVLRIKRNEDEHRDHFEKEALKVTGTAFYLLTTGLIIMSYWPFCSSAVSCGGRTFVSAHRCQPTSAIVS